MGTFNLAVELRGTGLDEDVTYALVLDMPMELGLKLVTVIGSHFADAEGELFDDVVDESDGTGLCIALIDFEGPDAGGIVDGGILVALDRLLVFNP